MCLAIPARVVKVSKDRIATVDFGGVRRKADLTLVPDAVEGDYVLIHAGYAIQKISKEDALEILELWKEVANFESAT